MKLSNREYEVRKANLEITLKHLKGILELAEKTDGISLGQTIEKWNSLHDMVHDIKEDLRILEINQLECVSVNR